VDEPEQDFLLTVHLHVTERTAMHKVRLFANNAGSWSRYTCYTL